MIFWICYTILEVKIYVRSHYWGECLTKGRESNGNTFIRCVCIVITITCCFCYILPSVCMYQHSSHQTDLCEIRYWGLCENLKTGLSWLMIKKEWQPFMNTLWDFEFHNSSKFLSILRNCQFFRNDHAPWCQFLSQVFEEAIIFKLWRDTKYL